MPVSLLYFPVTITWLLVGTHGPGPTGGTPALPDMAGAVPGLLGSGDGPEEWLVMVMMINDD